MPPIVRFAGDEQAHEKLALGLASTHSGPSVEQQESDEDVILLMRWRRAADQEGTAYKKPRIEAYPSMVRKDVSDELSGNGSSRNRKRKPERGADEQNKKERKKMSPSPSPPVET